MVIQVIGYFAVSIGFFAAAVEGPASLVIGGLVGGFLFLGLSWFLRRRLPDPQDSDRIA